MTHRKPGHPNYDIEYANFMLEYKANNFKTIGVNKMELLFLHCSFTTIK